MGGGMPRQVGARQIMTLCPRSSWKAHLSETSSSEPASRACQVLALRSCHLGSRGQCQLLCEHGDGFPTRPCIGISFLVFVERTNTEEPCNYTFIVGISWLVSALFPGG